MKWYIKFKNIVYLGIFFIQISDQSLTFGLSSFAPAPKLSGTAFFHSLKKGLGKVNPPKDKHSPVAIQCSYVSNHILPTVTRLSSVSSYVGAPLPLTIWPSFSGQLIRLKAQGVGNMTPYDQGIIVAIQNNTGDQLTINQISTASTSQVGSLNATGTSNHFLHTASLMPASTAAGSQDPVPGNMIEIADATAGASAYVQVVSGAQLQGLLNGNSGFNTMFTAADLGAENAMLAKANQAAISNLYFSYNQVGSSENYKPQGQYLLLTNFNTSTLSSTDPNITMYRMQAIDISQFALKPFFVTFQIDEKNSILYPSIVSIKTLLLQSLYNYNETAISNQLSYCSIPPLLIPEDIYNVSADSGVYGVATPYSAWLYLYAGALDNNLFELPSYIWPSNQASFSYPVISGLRKELDLFAVATQQQPARVVIDASGNLTSGSLLQLSTPFHVLTWGDIVNNSTSYNRGDLDRVIFESTKSYAGLQSVSSYMVLMGCDVVDIGSDYHKDIPVLNLYPGSTQGSVVANKSGGDWINLSVTLGLPAKLTGAPTTFAQGYGVPYNNVMLFSLPAAAMKNGVIGELSQTSAGNYELIFKDQTPTVLAVQKVFLDASIQNPTSMNIQFLNSSDAGWTSSTLIPSTIASVAVGKTNKFTLQYGASGNTLTAKVYIAPVTSAAMTATASQTLTLDQGDPITQLWMSPTFESGNFAELPLHAMHPKKLEELNKVLAFGTSVMIDWLVVPGQQGYDVLVSAYDKKAAKELFTIIMKNIPGVAKGKPSITNTDTFNGMNITYQIDSQPTNVIPFGEKNGLEFKVTGSIESPVATSLVTKTKPVKKTTTTGASAVTSLTTTSKPTVETVTLGEINTLKKQIQSLAAQVKKEDQLAKDKYEKMLLNDLNKKTIKLLKKVKTGITVKEFGKMKKQYKKLNNDLHDIISA